MLVELIVGVIVLLIIEICLYNEKFLGAILPLSAFITFVNLYANFSIWQFFLLNSNIVIIGIISYLIIGVIFALIKWKGYTANYYKNLTVNATQYSSIRHIDSDTKRNYIVGHISWWPFVLLVDVLHKPFEWIYGYITSIVDSIETTERNKVVKKWETPNEQNKN